MRIHVSRCSLVLAGLAAAFAFLGPPRLSSAEADLLGRVLSVYPDTTRAIAVMEEDPAGFRAAYDSLLANADLTREGLPATLAWAAEIHLAVSGDSLLIADYEFVSGASREAIRSWAEAVALDDRGFALRAEGDHEGSADAFRRAGEIYRSLGCLRREAVVWGSLGVSLWYTGDFEAVGEAYANALEARRRLGDPVLIGRTLNGLGSVDLQLGNLRGALDWYTQAKAVRETLGNPVDLGATVTYLGHIHYRLGNLEEARASYEQALELFGEDAPASRLNDVRNGLANVYSLLGEREKALDLYREVLASWIDEGDALRAAVIRGNLGIELIEMGDFAAALRELNLARDAQEAAGDLHALTATWNSIGRVQQLMGDAPAALRSYQEARKSGEESGNAMGVVEAMSNVAYAYHMLGLDDRALEAFDEVLAAAKESEYLEAYRDALAKKAMLLESRGEYDRALELYEETLARDRETGNRAGEAMDHLNLGNVLGGLGDLEGAERNFRRALALSEELDQRTAIWACYLGIADCHEQAGRLDSARVYNAKAIDAMESLRESSLSEESRTAFLGSKAFVYEAQVHVLAQLHAREPESSFAEEAWRTAERGKARALLDLLAEGRIDARAGAPPELAAELARVDRGLNAIGYRIRVAEGEGAPADSLKSLKRARQDLEDQREKVLERIRLGNPRVAALDAGPGRSLDDVRKRLLSGDQDVLLEYSLGDSASYLWVVTRNGLTLHRLPPRREIETHVDALRSVLPDPGPAGDARFLEAASALHRMLLVPAAEELRSARSLLIIPDGALQAIPFEVLLAGDTVPGAVPAEKTGREDVLAALPYGLVRVPVRYGPSASSQVMLEELRAGRKQGGARGFLGVGDPVFADPGAGDSTAAAGSLAALPFSRDEVESIAARFDPRSRTVLTGIDVQESRLKDSGFLGQFRWIHFATHGLIDERRPERSSLALSWPDDPSEDGFLRASEIYGLGLAADLVVLSACETGRGKTVRGEGVLGLPRAFFFAGASSVVVSLWSVSDRSTTELMKLFYEELVDRNRPAPEALARAKARLRETGEFAHPFYWAPFILLGAT